MKLNNSYKEVKMKNIFKNKKLLTFGIIGLFAMVLVSAGLLTYYGQVQQNVNVEQGLAVDGNSWNEPITFEYDTTSLENSIFVSAHTLENTATVNAIVDLSDVCTGVGSCDDITTTYYSETNLRSGTLELSKKDSNWLPIGTKVSIEYSTDEDGNFIIENPENIPTDYILVYYKDEEFADDPTRMGTPAKAYEVNGDFAIPSKDEGNTKTDVDYCITIDNYEHCKGAKLWLVPEVEYNPIDNTLAWATGWKDNYYFETDLLGWNEDNLLTNPITILAGEVRDFIIVTEFPVGVIPGSYTITTSVVPTA